MSGFYDKHIERLRKNPFSMESKKYIANPSRANICHILPKRKTGGFPSIAKVDLNIIYLTLDEHTDFDRYLDNRDFKQLEIDFPNVFKILQERLPTLLVFSDESGKNYNVFKEWSDAITEPS